MTRRLLPELLDEKPLEFVLEHYSAVVDLPATCRPRRLPLNIDGLKAVAQEWRADYDRGAAASRHQPTRPAK